MSPDDPGSQEDIRDRRSRSFGQVANDYDRYRPGYPDQLYEDVLALHLGGRVLEAGAGTGIATAELGRRGASVVAVEHDPEMAAVARSRTTGLNVEVVVSRFEDYAPAPGSFALVVAAQAWHWIDPVTGPEVAHQALGPDGSLCIWWNRPREFSGPIWEAIQRAYQTHAPALDRQAAMQSRNYGAPRPDHYPGFGSWVLRRYEWDQEFDADSYVGFLGTHSDHVLLPADARNALLGDIHGAIVHGGGRLTYAWRTLLYVACKS
ncbi:MAG: class I SAM-dependent methyltransferase [Chloroflexota bacterium]|nr:class I SAM-dependent methyltransferase [Chloroflexota bacterium]